VAIGGAPGPVTTTSLTFVRVGSEKATSFSRSGVTVTMAATMSTLPLNGNLDVAITHEFWQLRRSYVSDADL
jgi:hypothetical protein